MSPLPPLVDGVLPVRSVVPGTREVGAIYPATMLELAQHFVTSSHRRDLLLKFITLRTCLRGIGLTGGRQWVNGSFVDTPRTPAGAIREPNDIDVVTIANASQTSSPWAHTLVGKLAKQNFHIDHFLVNLDNPDLPGMVEYAAYWYEFWSARRHPPGSRKGFVSVDLSEDDSSAVAFLRTIP